MRSYIILICSFLFSCSSYAENDIVEPQKKPEATSPGSKIDYEKLIEKASVQYVFLKQQLNNASAFPKNYDNNKKQMETSNSKWWCSGFYPGTLLFLYEQTGKKELYDEAKRMLRLLTPEQHNTETHDIGFMMYCSYGNANRLSQNDNYDEILINSANSLITRFNPVVGCIKSHNRGENDFVVIIDNMMNLELLFWASKKTGDGKYYEIAVKHAETTLKNHFRPDYSLYHGINYDPQTGKIKNYQAGQGVSQNSAWSRGQAWGLYGYTMMFRFTKDIKYLNQAEHIAEFLFNHPNMPENLVPYWDFNAPDIPFALRDASSAAINCSALLELCQYVPDEQSKKYFEYAEKILDTLSSPAYIASKETNGGFILMHSVGNMPSKTEIDVAISYADYYYVEALIRYKEIIEKLNKNKN
jgi:rhamnogalacturonyl hydrolase YesR